MKAKEINKSVLRRIASAFEWIPNSAYDLGPNLVHAPSPRWRNSVMAPIIPLSRTIKKSDLLQIEKHFEVNPKKHKYDAPIPYLSLFDLPYYSHSSNLKVLRSLGWQKSKSKNRICLWTQPLPIVLPSAKIEVTHGAYSNPRLHRDFSKLMKLNFGCDERFLTDLDFMHRKSGGKIDLIVIYENSTTPVAAGLAFTNGKTTFLYCGSVIKSRRGKGLWTLLSASRQAVTRSGSDHLWFLMSNNEAIMRKGDISVPIRYFNKPKAEN